MKSTVFILSKIFVYLVSISLTHSLNDSPQFKVKQTDKYISRSGRAGIIAFKPFGEDVHLGLDLLLPFVKVPTKRKLNSNDNNEALVTVNTAALTIGGLISGIGLFIGHILRSLVTLRGRENIDVEGNEVETKSYSAEHRLDFDVEGGRFARILEPFKLVYRNSSGVRTHTSLSKLISIIEETFLENDIDLGACIQKSLCNLIQRADKNMEKGLASGVEKMIDGLLQLNWITQLTHETAVEDAILTGRSNSTEQCLLKYSTCKWESPEEHLLELVKKRVKFV